MDGAFALCSSGATRQPSRRKAVDVPLHRSIRSSPRVQRRLRHLGHARVDEWCQLYGSFGPGFTIHLQENGPSGDPVSSLRPRIDWLTVHDTSAIHNFHIFGTDPEATLDEVVTTTAFVGDMTVMLLLKPGDYTFQCDPHAAIGMKGTFTVGGVGQLDAD